MCGILIVWQRYYANKLKMAKFSAILIALLMLAAGSWLVLFDPALPTSTATATATVAALPLPAAASAYQRHGTINA